MINESSETPKPREVKIQDFNPKDLYGVLYGWKDIGEIETGTEHTFYGYSIGGDNGEEWDLQVDKYGVNDGGTLFLGNGRDIEFKLDRIKSVEFIGDGREVRFKSQNGTYVVDKYNHEFVSKDGSSTFVFHPPVSAAQGELKLLK